MENYDGFMREAFSATILCHWEISAPALSMAVAEATYRDLSAPPLTFPGRGSTVWIASGTIGSCSVDELSSPED
jgi:hypothetical protein